MTSDTVEDHDAGTRLLMGWGRINGSLLLQKRIELGFCWEDLAEREWAATRMEIIGLHPSGCAPPYNAISLEEDYHDTPNLMEMDVHERLLKHIESLEQSLGCDVEFCFKWMEWSITGEENQGRVEVEVSVECPNGVRVEINYLPLEVRKMLEAIDNKVKPEASRARTELDHAILVAEMAESIQELQRFTKALLQFADEPRHEALTAEALASLRKSELVADKAVNFLNP